MGSGRMVGHPEAEARGFLLPCRQGASDVLIPTLPAAFVGQALRRHS